MAYNTPPPTSKNGKNFPAFHMQNCGPSHRLLFTTLVTICHNLTSDDPLSG